MMIECTLAGLDPRRASHFMVTVARVPVAGDTIRRPVGATNYCERYAVHGVELNGGFQGGAHEVAAFAFVSEKQPLP